MIMRIWRGKVPEAKADAYLAYLQATGLSEYRSTAGNRGVFATTHSEGGVAEFVLVTLWESYDSIRSFAGADPGRAVYYPEDDSFLLHREPRVEHFEVRFAAGAPS